jgi:hypothetical protein
VIGVVPHEQGHAVAGIEAGLAQRRCKARHTHRKLAMRHAVVAAHDRRLRRTGDGDTIQHIIRSVHPRLRP